MEKKFRDHMKAFYEALAKNKAKNLIIAVLLLTTIFGAYQYDRAVKLRRELNNTYNRAFFEMVGYVQNVRIGLMKARMTSSPELTATTLREVWNQANAATSNLSQLPIAYGVLTNTQKFLSQVADYSQSLAKQNVRGNITDGKQTQTLANLHKFSLTLEDSLNEMKNDLNNGNFRWENVVSEQTREMQKTSQEMPKGFDSIDQNFQEMPTLIYDGPYSEHMQNVKALGLTGSKVTDNQAVSSISKFLGQDRVRNIQKLADNNNNIINTYNFRMELAGKKDKSVAEADVSQMGGHVVWYLYNRDVGTKTIDINKAKEIGRNFLTSRGYPDMKDTYYLQTDGIAVINYAYTKNGVTYYPDLIKVKVALDNGEIVGFEANGYYMNHRNRDLAAPKLKEAEARAKVTKGDNIKASGLALIPTTYGTEILCYEFIGKLDDKDFLVYINANTGAEEQVFMIINTEDGVLTM